MVLFSREAMETRERLSDSCRDAQLRNLGLQLEYRAPDCRAGPDRPGRAEPPRGALLPGRRGSGQEAAGSCGAIRVESPGNGGGGGSGGGPGANSALSQAFLSSASRPTRPHPMPAAARAQTFPFSLA